MSRQLSWTKPSVEVLSARSVIKLSFEMGSVLNYLIWNIYQVSVWDEFPSCFLCEVSQRSSIEFHFLSLKPMNVCKHIWTIKLIFFWRWFFFIINFSQEKLLWIYIYLDYIVEETFQENKHFTPFKITIIILIFFPVYIYLLLVDKRTSFLNSYILDACIRRCWHM